jgi:glucose-6-phosphate isomerase
MVKKYLCDDWKAAMRLSFDFNHMMADFAADARAAVRSDLRKAAHSLEGAELAKVQTSIAKLSDPPGRLLKKNFIEAKDMNELAARLAAASDAVQAARGSVEKMMLWTELPYNQQEVVRDINETAAAIRERFENFVVLGIGGSALGPAMVQQALRGLRHNELPGDKRPGPRIYIEDNVDPERMVSLLNLVDLDKTCFNVISKSGNTSETMSQYLIISDLLKQRFGDKYGEHLILTTDAKKGNLNKIGHADGLKMFVVPDGVGGRFSELCPVGLLAAAVAGIDIEELLAGAAAMDERCRASDYRANPALFAAGAMYAAMDKGLNIHVMMPYADSLKFMADWYAQLWAESLGKNELRGGEPCQIGQTPVKSLGVTDQHSQVQLYTEGPDDKVITFLRVGEFHSKITIPVGCEEFPDVSFLCGHTLNELMDAELRATEYALLKAAKPSWMITLPEVNAYTLGQLMYFFEMQTAYAGELYNIDAFNQPGVEEGKNAAYALLGRHGYENKAVELNARPDPDPRYVL